MNTTLLKEEEDKLLARVAKGDQDAFDCLFRSYYRFLVTVAYGYTRDKHLSMDLAQDVFIDIWKRRLTLSINTSFRAFLKRAVINQSLTALKKRNKLAIVSDDAIQTVSDDNAQKGIELDELNQKIQVIISCMPERCKEVFMLSRYENLSHKEIAAKLNISTKTIENQITKALKMLRNGLKEEHFLSFIFLLIIL